MSKQNTIVVVSGVEGPSIYINDYRVAGPKPWGGGSQVYEFKASREDIEHALSRAPSSNTGEIKE